jgi:hypothetical protein
MLSSVDYCRKKEGMGSLDGGSRSIGDLVDDLEKTRETVGCRP